MGADQTPDPTAWDDNQLDDLLDALAQRAAERDDLNLPGSGPSRRTVLATLLGAGGIGLGATQLGSAASWGSASGTIGTDSEPLDTANIRDLDAKLLETEQTNVTNRLDLAGTRYAEHIEEFSSNNANKVSLSAFNSISRATTTREIIIDVFWYDAGEEQDLILRLNGDGSSSGDYIYTDDSGTRSTGQNEIVLLTELDAFGGGRLTISVTRRFDAVISVARAGVRSDRTDVEAIRGSRNVDETISSIELIQTGSTDGELNGRVFERRV